MLIAANEAGDLVSATPGAHGTCPHCGEVVHAKTGSIVAWHWAHASREDCDAWGEPETAWHRGWKHSLSEAALEGPACSLERTISRDDARHRADVVSPAGIVLELQHSTISPEDIQARERFYARMWWLFDAREAYKADRLRIGDRGDYWAFQWLHAKKSLTAVHQRLFLQLDSFYILEVRKKSLDKRLFGWGHLLSVPEFSRLVRTAS